MKKLVQKSETTRQLVHIMLEFRDELRRFMQKKFRENNIDLTYEMHQIMACLWKTDGLSQQELADLTVKDKSSMTFLIDNLVKRGLVKRTQDPEDRRRKLIYLTFKGKQLGIKVDPWLGELFAVASGGFENSTLKTCIDAVEKMRDNVRSS